MPQRFALVTGVSTGIGRAIAERLAAEGMHVLGSVRQPKDAAPLLDACKGKFTPLCFDVRDEAAIRAAVPLVEATVGNAGLAGLVNNAGIGNLGPVMHVPMDEVRQLFEINVFGVLNVTRAFLPLLGTDPKYRRAAGRIVNISSMSGRVVHPLYGTYAASKFALEALSDGLRRELTIYGIRVIIVQPGAVATPIWEKNAGVKVTRLEDTPAQVYGKTDFARYCPGYDPGGATEQGRAVADVRDLSVPLAAVSGVVWKALSSRAPRARYTLPDGTFKARIKQRFFYKHMPDAWVDRRIALRGRAPEQPDGDVG